MKAYMSSSNYPVHEEFSVYDPTEVAYSEAQMLLRGQPEASDDMFPLTEAEVADLFRDTRFDF